MMSMGGRNAHDRVERVLAEQGRPLDATEESPLVPEIPQDRSRRFEGTGFSRVRIDWDGDDREVMRVILAETDQIIKAEFGMAFKVLAAVRKRVRLPAADPATGEKLADEDGSPVWETDEDGLPVENWGLLRDSDRLNLRGVITSFLYEWELISVDKWTEAMFAKVQWEDRFSHGFTVLPGVEISGRPTIEDRTQYGNRLSLEARYLAVFKSALSRKADHLIRSMVRLDRLLEGTATR